MELRYADGSMYTIDCTAAENEVARNMYECAEPDYLMNNDPVGYAQLVFNGDPESYPGNVTEYKPLDHRTRDKRDGKRRPFLRISAAAAVNSPTPSSIYFTFTDARRLRFRCPFHSANSLWPSSLS